MKIKSLEEDFEKTLRDAEAENDKLMDEKQKADKNLKNARAKFASLEKALKNKEEQINIESARSTRKECQLK